MNVIYTARALVSFAAVLIARTPPQLTSAELLNGRNCQRPKPWPFAVKFSKQHFLKWPKFGQSFKQNFRINALFFRRKQQVNKHDKVFALRRFHCQVRGLYPGPGYEAGWVRSPKLHTFATISFIFVLDNVNETKATKWALKTPLSYNICWWTYILKICMLLCKRSRTSNTIFS